MTQDELSGKLAEARQVAAVVTAFALPLSTSAQAIAVSIFAVLALLTLDRLRFEATLRMPAAWLPVALFVLVLLGVLWSVQPWGLALKWVGPYAKLLLIPLLLATAFTPRQAMQIGIGFLAACTILLVLSAASFVYPSGPWTWFKSPGVPVKDNAVQSGCFALCAFGLALGAFRTWRAGNSRAVVMAALALLFFADVFLIYLSKTGAIMAVVLLALLLLHLEGWKRRLLAAVPAVIVIAMALLASAQAQRRLAEISTDINAGNTTAPVAPTPPANGAVATAPADAPAVTAPATGASPTMAPTAVAPTVSAPPANAAPAAATAIAVAADTSGETLSTAARLDFWKKAIGFVKQAPFLGHGTGSIKPLYQSLQATSPSPYGEATPDPHNQFLHVVLQTGLIGGALLLAMWVAHARLFLHFGTAAIMGQAIVLENVVGSLFNSHISAVTQGMLYCLAAGLLGSVVHSTSVMPGSDSSPACDRGPAREPG